jgi:methyl-accepting chemotaxis protein
MEMEKKPCQTLCKGLWIGGAVALTVILAKKEWRERLKEEASELKQGTTEALTFIRENREQIFDQVRDTATEVSQVIRDISEDVKKISETASHLKESSEEIIQATKDAASEVKQLKNKPHA